VNKSKAMEDVKPVIIPTRIKDKISHELSFPIGAERISIALASVKQLPQLVLDFCSDRFGQVRLGHDAFLSVRYAGREKPVNPISSYSGIPSNNKWEIVGRPVSRIFRHRIQLYILDSALPQIKQWLDQRVNLDHEGSEALGFFFDEKKEEFVSKQRARLQPVRESKRQDLETLDTQAPTSKPKKEHSRP
jgi:dsDNA-binding SOS-regulon protein